MDDTAHAKYTRIMLLILAVLLLIASIVGYLVSRKLQTNQNAVETASITPAPTIAPTLIPYPTQGSFVLKMQTGAQSIQVGTPFTIDLIATSSKETVAGYDVILTYNTNAFDRQSVQNKTDAFRIFPFDRTTHVSISATKNLSISEPIQFSDTPILSFTFLAKKKGTYVFSLKPSGNESSKLVNESAQVTYPETTDLRLEIN